MDDGHRIGANDWTANFDGTPLDALRGLWDTITGDPQVPPQGPGTRLNTYVGPGALEFPLMSYLTGELAVQQAAMPLFLAGLVMLLGYLTRPVPRPGEHEVVIPSAARNLFQR